MDLIEQAIKECIDQGLIDSTGSKKRLNGLEEVRMSMDAKSKAALPPLIIFSPSIETGGATFRREIPPGHCFVYLSPGLEKEFQINATWTIAHELAHVVLGHGKKRQQTNIEVKADEKAASDLADSWVPKCNPERSRFCRLIEKGEEALGNGKPPEPN